MIEYTPVRTSLGDAVKAVLFATFCALSFGGRAAYAQAPVVASLSPTSGYAAQGSPVEIIGSNFGTSGTVTFNGTPATSFSYWGANTIVAYIPPGATTGPLVVTTSAGSSGSSTVFTILSSLSLTSVSPSAASPGTPLTISGTNLTGCSQVEIGYQWVGSTSASSTIMTSVPVMASGSAAILALCNGVATNTLPFTVLPPPTLNGVSPAGGYSGTTVTLTGTGLSYCTSVSLGGTLVAGTATATSITTTLPTETQAGYIPAYAICGTYRTAPVEFLVHTHYDNGTVALTLNGITDSVSYALSQNSTSTAVAASLISAINTDSNAYVKASANGSSGITLTSKDPGAVADFTFSLVDNYDTYDFSVPSFTSTPSSGKLTGGSNPTVTTGVTVYKYSIPSPGTATSGYDPDGNLLSYTDSMMGTWSFGYDPLNRLTSALVSSGSFLGQNLAGATLGWTYDQFGNRLTQRSNSATVPAAGLFPTGSTQFTGANNRATGTGLVTSPTVSTTTLNYDTAGNLAGKNGAVQSLYDAEGRLCATQIDSGGYEGYIYDAEGRRVAKGTITSLSCDQTANGFALASQYLLGPSGEQMTELNGTGGWVHTNVTANGSLFATFDNDNKGVHFTLTDWLGTKRIQTNYLGAVEETCQGLPFGDALNCSGSVPDATEHHFTGKERDTESGLDYFGARYYSSNMGRMMSPDWSAKVMPVPYAKLDNPQSLNLYAYVGNNPLRFTDPTGHYLVNCAANDKGCNKGIDNFEKQRQKDLKSKDASVRAGAAAWGDRGADNGVSVTFKTQEQVNADTGKTTVNAFVRPGVTADHKANITAEFSESLGGSSLGQTVAHEGTHVSDDLNFINSYNPATGKYNEGFNMSHADAEFRAFEAGAGVTPYTYRNSEVQIFAPGPSGYQQLQDYIGRAYKDVADQPLFPGFPTAYPQ